MPNDMRVATNRPAARAAYGSTCRPPGPSPAPGPSRWRRRSRTRPSPHRHLQDACVDGTSDHEPVDIW